MAPSWAKDRGTLLTGAGLVGVTAAAWLEVLRREAAMGAADMAPSALAFLAAWLVMMTAMMLPSAAPMVLLHRKVAAGEGALPGLLTWLFVAGYLLVWGALGLGVYVAGQALALAGPLPLATAGVLVLAGLYQFSPLKSVCLRQCRTPLGFLMERYRRGLAGALRLGIDHGVYCVGCCWGLMAVLVVAGAMGLPWVTLIALAVFVEKVLPRGEGAARVIGLGLVGVGLLVALQPGLAPLLAGKGVAMR